MRKHEKPVFNASEIFENIINVTAKKLSQVGYGFCRVEEFSENTDFKGKYGFTLDDVKHWWKTKTEEGRKHPTWFNYPYWFESYNVLATAFDFLKDSRSRPWSIEETALTETVFPIIEARPDVYIIGSEENASAEQIGHELRHGFWHFFPDYKASARIIMRRLKPEDRSKLDRYLLTGNGYDKSVLVDERHAWLATEEDDVLENSGVKFRDLIPVRTALNELFERTYEEKRKK